MGETTGARVALDDVPLKYAGLQPWEIWLSEAQERMVLAVPPANLDALLALCASEDVEATVIGQFTGDGRLTVTHGDRTVVDLAMAFMHKGIPQRTLEAVWTTDDRPPTTDHRQEKRQTVVGSQSSVVEALKALLAHPNIASKAAIIRTYDHEIRGGTIVKPLVGANCMGRAMPRCSSRYAAPRSGWRSAAGSTHAMARSTPTGWRWPASMRRYAMSWR